MTRSCCHNCTRFKKCGPCTSVDHSMRYSYPLVMSKPPCGGAYLLHHTDPTSLVHQSARFHRLHQHWHLWNEIWLDSVLPVPVSFLLTGIFYAFGLHWTCWLLNNPRNLLLLGIQERKVVIPLLLLLLLGHV